MSEKLPRIDCQELIRALERAGFVWKRQKGSHPHMWRETDRKRVTIPVHKGKIVPPGTLRAILRDANISIEEFRTLL
ncbi:type II toxin-antitoxin system HicA family toxin [thermophilic bacterium 2918]|uniref:Type II toxin-antitoxin system HicA family toxin n=1 Tax=Thermogemmata fonticola TaxID=2755323 RepID=A0A7V9ACQ7_9BACT|nr:type II toxin-antitoxin system HicA family toxin [Thermogemmata fonticola]